MRGLYISILVIVFFGCGESQKDQRIQENEKTTSDFEFDGSYGVEVEHPFDPAYEQQLINDLMRDAFPYFRKTFKTEINEMILTDLLSCDAGDSCLATYQKDATSCTAPRRQYWKAYNALERDYRNYQAACNTGGSSCTQSTRSALENRARAIIASRDSYGFGSNPDQPTRTEVRCLQAAETKFNTCADAIVCSDRQEPKTCDAFVPVLPPEQFAAVTRECVVISQ